MTRNANQVHRISLFALTFLAASGLALAQDQTPPAQPQQQAPPPGSWRRVGDPPPAQPATPADPSAPQQNQDPSQPVDRTDAYGQPLPAAPQDVPPPQAGPPQGAPPVETMPQNFPQQNFPQQNVPPQGMPPQNRPAYGIPAEVSLQSGTYLTARINQMLSSDHNLPGDTFTASLIQPLIVNGIVVAQRGQTVYGRISEAQKAHSDKPSRLGLELTGITLADGTQVPVKSTLANRQGGTTPAGVQAGTVAGTTAVGAAIGGAVGWGTGAAIGAGAGMMAGLAGVLLTRNHPTIIYPETALTFQVTSPVVVATGRAPQAFHYAGPNDYGPGPGVRTQLGPRPPTGYPGYPYGGAYYGAYGPGPYAYYPPYPYYYPYWGYPWGGFGVVVGGGRFGRWR